MALTRLSTKNPGLVSKFIYVFFSLYSVSKNNDRHALILILITVLSTNRN